MIFKYKGENELAKKKFIRWQNKLQQRAQQRGENSAENATTQLQPIGFT